MRRPALTFIDDGTFGLDDPIHRWLPEFANPRVLNSGRANRQILAQSSVGAMMTDQVPEDAKVRSPFVPGFWEKRGCGYGGAPVKKHVPGEPRAGFGWEGGYGLCAYWDAETGLFGMVLSQCLIDTPEYPPLYKRFWDAVNIAAEA